MFQDKAQFAENGMSFSRTATPYWSIWVAPFGRAVKQSSAVLHLLLRTRHYRQGAPSATAPCVALPPASLQSCGQPLHDPL